MQSKMLVTNIVYRVLNVVVVFIISILLSRLTGVAGYGLLSLMIANATIFNLVSALGADAGIGFHAASGRLSPGKLISFVTGIVLFQLVLLGIVEAVMYALKGHFFLLRTAEMKYAWMGPLFLVSISLTEKYSALLNGKQLFSLCNKMLLAGNLLVLALFTLLWFSASQQPVYYVGAYILLNCIQAIILMIAYHSKVKLPAGLERPGKKDAFSFFSYSVFTFIINSIQFLAYRVDYWILDHYKGEAELGWYAIAVKLSQLFWVLPLLFASIIFPKAAGEMKQFNQAGMQALVRGMNWVNIAGGVVLFFLAGWFIPLLYGKEYANSVGLFRFLLPGMILFCIATILAAYFAGQNKLKVNLGGSLLCLGVILTLDFLLIPSKGMKGAAIASSVGYGITALYFVVVYCYSGKVSLSRLIIPRRDDMKYIRELFGKNST
jgi:O-antigen/teichoic acid export membrane protein